MQGLGNKKIMAKNLKRLMSEKGVTAKELSKTLAFPYTTLLSWLKADNYPRIDKIEAMANFFGVLKSELIEEKLTEKKKKDNDLMADVIVRMRMDEDFRNFVFLSMSVDSEKLKSVSQLLSAFDK